MVNTPILNGIIVFRNTDMSHEPCSDIRFRLWARKEAKSSSEEGTNSDKENQKPSGLKTDTPNPSGRGRGVLMRERWEQRHNQGK